MLPKSITFEKYKSSVSMINKEIVTNIDNPQKLQDIRDRDLSQLFVRVVERVNKNYRKSNGTVVEQINKITGFNVNRFNKLLTENVQFVPSHEEIGILEWLLSNDIEDFTANLKIKYGD